MDNKTFALKEESFNKPATKKQLWALFAASKKCGEKHDYRNDNLTMKEASDLLTIFNAKNVVSNVGVGKTEKNVAKAPSKRKNTLENEFLAYMEDKIQDAIAIAKDAIKIKSVVEDDKEFFPNKKDRKQFAFFGFGCGITIIDFDKRSKVGKAIEELSSKHHMTTCLQMFLKGFTKKQIDYFHEVGFPLEAMFYQDYHISRKYQSAVASFMVKKGVKNVRMRTFDD